MENRNDQARNDKARLATEIRNKKYIDNYLEKWLNLGATDKPYVECEVCGYASNASIRQYLLVPKEFIPDPDSNRLLHLCANCYYEHRAIIDRHRTGMVPEKIPQICEDAFEKLKDRKKPYRDANKNLGRIEV